MRQGKDDAFGEAALAYLDGDQDARILLLSDADTPGDEPDSEGMREYFQEYDDFDDPLKAILPFASGRVLDIGCGAGRFALYLQGQGLEVVGVDESSGAVEVCRRRGLHDVRWADVETLNADEVGFFDTFLLLGHNLGIGGTPEGVRDLLKRFASLGRGKARLLVNSFEVEVSGLRDERTRRDIECIREMGRYPGQKRYCVRYVEHDTGWFDWIHLSPRELDDLATRAGWRLKLVVRQNSRPGYWSGVLERGEWDAFGAASMACHRGEPAVFRLIYDDGKQSETDMSHYYESPSVVGGGIDLRILEEAQGRVLDVGCGAGRYALHLQRRGLEVVGVDESPLAVEVSKLRGLKECFVMDVQHLDTARLGYFDTVIFMGSNLGIGGTPDGLRRMLASLHPITTSRARLLFSSGGVIPEAQLTDEMRQECQENLVRHGYARQSRFRVVFGAYDTGEFDWIAPTLDDLRAWAEDAGWRITKVLFAADAERRVSRMAGSMEKLCDTLH